MISRWYYDELRLLDNLVSGVFDFYTFEDYYLELEPPFQESTANIREQLHRINTTTYAVSGPSLHLVRYNNVC
jgi:hypothetical protein